MKDKEADIITISAGIGIPILISMLYEVRVDMLYMWTSSIYEISR